MRWLVWLKGCMRCGGDLSLERDGYGPYISCIQCGAITDEQLAPVPVPVEQRTLVPLPRA